MRLASPGRHGRFGGKGARMFAAANPASLLFVLQGQGQIGSPFGSPIVLFALLAIIFYFLMIMPAQRRQKKTGEMLKNLKTGDKVITNGGLYGTIVGLEADSVQLRIAEQVKVKLARNAIAGLQAEPPKES